ncbi:MAG: hypothetical protein JXJ17_13425 [Anaerolineae bacterium]|nr:hypothetical protein [Anaerolineae bacterium]
MKLDTNALWKSAAIAAGGGLVLALLKLIPLAGIVCCCLLWLGYAGAGVLYGVFAKQGENGVDAGSGALGGAIAGAAAGLMAGIVGAISSLIMGTAGMMSSLSQLQDQGIDVPPEMYDMYGSAAVGPMSAVMSLCGAFIFAAILGAIGGVIYGATQKDKGEVPPAAPAE